MKITKYDPKATCMKCGCISFVVVFHPKGKAVSFTDRYNEIEGIRDHSKVLADHLTATCTNCKFTRFWWPIDKDESPTFDCENDRHDWVRLKGTDQASQCSICRLVSGK